jgi:oxygen-independent coproporphyrinogen III oxidase
MILRVIGHRFHYEMENLCRVFLPTERIIVVYGDKDKFDENTVTTQLIPKENGAEIFVQAVIGFSQKEGRRIVDSQIRGFDAECERLMAIALFEIMSQLTGYKPSWGILTGVRPTKLISALIKKYGEKQAVDYFKNKLIVNEEKTALSLTVAKNEEKVLDILKPNCVSLYVAIPFCPSRCSYCSFVSHSISGTKAKKIVPEYIENLCKEIEATGEIAHSLGLKPQTVYIGGGTPTSVNDDYLKKLLTAISENFDLSSLDEYTVEAGRPDTITAQKLNIVKTSGVNRISINPQSFNDLVLEKAGRNHSSQCAVQAYELAREFEFETINMDFIAGLPFDSVDSFINTIDFALDLNPENITVHTLALKRAATLKNNGEALCDGNSISKMLKYAGEKLRSGKYRPYYMYRQSLSPGNNENVGWCSTGHECLYNVLMIEECQSVLGVGAGGVTKLKQTNGNRIERIFNFKYPYEYNSRFGEIIERKTRVLEFYKEYN